MAPSEADRQPESLFAVEGTLCCPIIGVSSRRVQRQSFNVPYQGVGQAYIEALVSHGAVPLLIPNGLPRALLRRALAHIDGLLLSGGGDVDPSFYGEPRSEYCQHVDRVRDETELRLTRMAVACDKPVLAICRGIQVLNVAAGGTLYQDIEAERPGSAKHRHKERALPVHTVSLEPDSMLGDVLGEQLLEVNSLHHQAVKSVGRGLRVVGVSEDGLVEAIEMPGKRFIVGVQWHPEEMATRASHARALFASFVAAAAKASPVRRAQQASIDVDPSITQ